MDNKNNNLSHGKSNIVIGGKIIEISSYNPSNSDNANDVVFPKETKN